MDNKIVYCQLQKEEIPELEIVYGDAFYNIYYGAQYNYDFPIIYDLHRHPAERIKLFYNDLNLRYNDDIINVDLGKYDQEDIIKYKDNAYILNLNSTILLKDDKIKEARSNNNINQNNLYIKNPVNLNLFTLSYFFKFNKEKNLIIKFNTSIYNVVPQLIYLYKSCFEKSEIFKSYDDNRLKDSFVFYGTNVIVDRVKTIRNKIKELLRITREDELKYEK